MGANTKPSSCAIPKPPDSPFGLTEYLGRGRAALQGRPARPLFINISNSGIEIVPPQRENGPKKPNEVLTLGPAAEPLAAKEKTAWPGASQGAGNRLRQSGARGQKEPGSAPGD